MIVSVCVCVISFLFFLQPVLLNQFSLPGSADCFPEMCLFMPQNVKFLIVRQTLGVGNDAWDAS